MEVFHPHRVTLIRRPCKFTKIVIFYIWCVEYSTSVKYSSGSEISVTKILNTWRLFTSMGLRLYVEQTIIQSIFCKFPKIVIFYISCVEYSIIVEYSDALQGFAEKKRFSPFS